MKFEMTNSRARLLVEIKVGIALSKKVNFEMQCIISNLKVKAIFALKVSLFIFVLWLKDA